MGAKDQIWGHGAISSQLELVPFCLWSVGEITGKMFDHPIEKDCASDLSDPGSCRTGPVRQVAGPENAAI